MDMMLETVATINTRQFGALARIDILISTCRQSSYRNKCTLLFVSQSLFRFSMPSHSIHI